MGCDNTEVVDITLDDDVDNGIADISLGDDGDNLPRPVPVEVRNPPTQRNHVKVNLLLCQSQFCLFGLLGCIPKIFPTCQTLAKKFLQGYGWWVGCQLTVTFYFVLFGLKLDSTQKIRFLFCLQKFQVLTVVSVCSNQ